MNHGRTSAVEIIRLKYGGFTDTDESGLYWVQHFHCKGINGQYDHDSRNTVDVRQKSLYV